MWFGILTVVRRASRGWIRLLAVAFAVLVGSFVCIDNAGAGSAIHATSGNSYDTHENVAPGSLAALGSVATVSSSPGGGLIPSAESALALQALPSDFVAPNTTRIFRSVEPDELADLIGSGQFRNVEGIGGGKYFFPTEAQADNFAALMTKPGRGPYCTTSGCIPEGLLAQVDQLDLPLEGTAYFVPQELLPYIDDIVIHGR